jgi:hypothetical protein
MKQIIVLLLLSPLTSIAQTGEQASTTAHACYTIHFNKLVMHEDDQVMSKNEAADIIIDDDLFELPGPVHIREATDKEKRDYQFHSFRADKVILTDASPFVLMGDKMVYDRDTHKASITGHVRMVVNGYEQPLGGYAALDMSAATYKIEKIR